MIDSWKFKVENLSYYRGNLIIVNSKNIYTFSIFWENLKKSKNKELKDKIKKLKKEISTRYLSTVGKTKIGNNNYYLWTNLFIAHPYILISKDESYSIEDKIKIYIKIKKAFIKAMLPNSLRFIGDIDD